MLPNYDKGAGIELDAHVDVRRRPRLKHRDVREPVLHSYLEPQKGYAFLFLGFRV